MVSPWPQTGRTSQRAQALPGHAVPAGRGKRSQLPVAGLHPQPSQPEGCAQAFGVPVLTGPLDSHRLPDGSERYLVDEALLMGLTHDLGGELLDPLKTTVVQNQRCMTTWVLRKVA